MHRTLAAAAFAALLSAAPAVAQTVVVAGNANPFLAGQPAGTNCCGGDTAPGQSPTLGALVAGGQVLTFSTTGGASFDPGTAPATSADGFNDGVNYTARFNMTSNYGTGIAGAQGVNVSGLVGVFLTSATPTGSGPASLDFTGSGGSTGLDFLVLAPGLAQIFWIGDGRTGIGTGVNQQFVAPTGATRLFLGTVDGFGWSNNTGQIVVTVAGANGAVPEPATWALIVTGFGAVGAGLRRRRSLTFRPA